MISQYWVGQKPASPLIIEIRNDNGELVDCSAYTTFTVEILDPYNDYLDTLNGSLNTSSKATGRFIWTWPTSASLFDFDGEYLFRFKMTNNNAEDYTSHHTFYVSHFGGTR